MPNSESAPPPWAEPKQSPGCLFPSDCARAGKCLGFACVHYATTEPAQTANPGCDTWYRESYVKQLEARLAALEARPEWTAEKNAALEYLLGSVENIYLRLSLPLRADDTRAIARAAFPEKSDV